MEHLAQSVAAEVAHDRAALGLDIGLDGIADVAERPARLHLGDAAQHGLVGDVDEPPRPGGDLADAVHAAGVAMPAAVDNHGHVDVDDVAFPQRPVRRNAVADHVVGRDADRLGVATVEQAGGQGAVVEDELARHLVDVVRDGPRLHQGRQEVQALRREAAGPPHALEPLLIMKLDLRSAGGDVEDVSVAHARNLDRSAPQLGAGSGSYRAIAVGFSHEMR